jgi:uncharacterized membrane protein
MKTKALVTSFALGAGLMYLMDPERGRRRRALIRDQAVHGVRKTADAVDATSSDLRNRLHGLAAELQHMFRHETVSDTVLTERVRAVLGTVCSHPGSITVTASDGHVIMTGPILQRELRRTLKRVARVRGVLDVEDRLEVYPDADHIPGLQGEPSRRASGARFEFMQTYWSPTGRLFAGLSGLSLAGYGAVLRGIPGVGLALAGGMLLARALTNLEFKRLLGVGVGERAVDIQKTMHIAAPIDQVFELWSNPENFPKFMSHVREVRQIGDKRWHWIVTGPAGATAEWDAVTTSFIPQEEITWRTEPGSLIQHAGTVRFEPESEGSTKVELRLSYNPVAGGIGHALATLLGANPKKQLDDDLMRMKSFIETGVMPHDAAAREKERAAAAARDSLIH